MSYIGMTSRHSVTRDLEHLHLPFNKTAITQHIKLRLCSDSSKLFYSVGFYEIGSRQCHDGFENKVQEALLIKKLKLKLSTRLYANR